MHNAEHVFQFCASVSFDGEVETFYEIRDVVKCTFLLYDDLSSESLGGLIRIKFSRASSSLVIRSRMEEDSSARELELIQATCTRTRLLTLHHVCL